MAFCLKCGSAKLTEQPCPRCGTRENQEPDPRFITGHLNDMADLGYRINPSTGQYEKSGQ